MNYYRRHALILVALFFLPDTTGLAGGVASAAERNVPLLIRNSFSTPEETLNHFLRRDEVGAFWAGMLEPERRAFTTWKAPPQAESYLRFKDRKTGETRRISPDEVAIPVTLTLIDHRDGFGTRLPANTRQNQLEQVFRLKRIDGQWKIVQPDANSFLPAIRIKER